ncbi:MAG TPA: hypothetical protein VG101_03015 [Puia sp.]|nr:hypothetical protein [Puia sp.]
MSALSELVSGIGRQTPYGVPAGYFDQLPAFVMGRIGSTFRAPEGYFDGFAASVLARIKAGATASIPTGESMIPAMGESVEEELARLSIVISGISRKLPYTIPEGYFDGQSPLLTVARDFSTYQVPVGYFAGLPESILEKVAEQVTVGKVIPMDPVAANRRKDMPREGGKVLKGNWWKYSSVASIAACLLLIFSWPQPNTGISERDITHSLANLSDQEIQTYLDDQHAILSVSADNSTAAVDPGTATLDLNEGDVKSLLGEVSDSDLQQYMEEHGKADDLATN